MPGMGNKWARSSQLLSTQYSVIGIQVAKHLAAVENLVHGGFWMRPPIKLTES